MSEFFKLLDERTSNDRERPLVFERQEIEMISLFRKIQNPRQKDVLIKSVKDRVKKLIKQTGVFQN